MAERLALPTLDHGVTGSNPAGGEILPETKRHFIAQSLSCSPFHRLEMTELLLKGCKTLTRPSIHYKCDLLYTSFTFQKPFSPSVSVYADICILKTNADMNRTEQNIALLSNI